MFNVYITAAFLTPKDKVDENPILTCENDPHAPLDAERAMHLAKECSERVSVGYVRVVDIADDAIVFEWHFKLGVLFPKQ